MGIEFPARRMKMSARRNFPGTYGSGDNHAVLPNPDSATTPNPSGGFKIGTRHSAYDTETNYHCGAHESRRQPRA